MHRVINWDLLMGVGLKLRLRYWFGGRPKEEEFLPNEERGRTLAASIFCLLLLLPV